MPAAKKNIVIEQFSTFTLPLRYLSKARIPIDLTGYSAQMTIRSSTGALMIDMLTTNARIVLGGVLGTIAVTLSPIDTGGLSTAGGFYDLVLTNPTGIKTRLLEGAVTVKQGQSR